MNRGIARRTLFETRGDIRFFLSRLARAVRRGQIEVHAYCVMTTHFHLLVRSPAGALSAALQAIQNEYVRRFNRRRRRDGPLMRSRFRSKPVRSEEYRRTLVRYIDGNPIDGGLVRVATAYPYGSARHHARSAGPPWLERSWIRSCLREASEGIDTPRTYEDVFGRPLEQSKKRLVEIRSDGPTRSEDPLDDLLDAAAPRIRDWMQRKAALADGTRPGVALVEPESVDAAVTRSAREEGEWRVKPTRKSIDAWTLVRVALLRELCGTTIEEAARRVDRALPTVLRLLAHHRRLVVNDAAYAMRIAELARSTLDACHREASTKP